MPLPRPSRQELEQRAWNRILATTNLTSQTESSAIAMLVKESAAAIDEWWAELERVAQDSNLLTAVGGALDNHGLKLGVPRKQGTRATTTGLGRAVRFQNNGGSSVTVQSGVRVWKRDTPQVAFFTTEGISLNAGFSGEVHVVAADQGSIYNVGIGQITEHNFPNSSVSVTNILPIENGNFLESDDVFRERLVQEYRRRRVLNVANATSLLRSVPGVKDVFLINLARGAGTFDCIIIPESYQNISSVISQCQSLLDDAVPAGIKARALPPVFRQLDISMSLKFAPEASAQKETIRQEIRTQIQSRIDNLPVETGDGRGSLFVSQFRASSALASDLVLDSTVSVGLDNVPLGQDGEIRVGKGERIILRSLSVV